MLRQFEELERKINKVEAERNKFLGKKESLMEELKSYGFNNLKKARMYLTNQQKTLDKLENDIKVSVDKFIEEYGDLL